MTVAAQEIDVLNALLTKRATKHAKSYAAASSAARNSSSSSDAAAKRWLHGLPNELQQAVLPILKAAWRLSVGNDMKFEGFVSNDVTLGGLGGSSGIANYAASKAEGVLLGYVNNVFTAAARDPSVSNIPLLSFVLAFSGVPNIYLVGEACEVEDVIVCLMQECR
jgi:hypothetical protein